MALAYTLHKLEGQGFFSFCNLKRQNFPAFFTRLAKKFDNRPLPPL